MGLINGFGYTNFHEVNLDYIIKLVRENAGLHLDISGNQLLLKTLDGTTVSSVTIHYAEEAGHADTATTATNATYATSASTATTATNATNASHALTADSATTAGTATTATTATTASTATEASHATTADTALLANRATVADSATYAESTGSVEHASKAFEAVSANGLKTRFTKGDGTTVDFNVPSAIKADMDTQNNPIASTYIANVVDNDGTLDFKNALGNTIVSITPSATVATNDSYNNLIADFIKNITVSSNSNYVTVNHGTGTADTLVIHYSETAWKDTNDNVIKNTYIKDLAVVEDDNSGHYNLVAYNGDNPQAELFRVELIAYRAQIADEAAHATSASTADYATNAGTATTALTSTGSVSSISTTRNIITINNGDGTSSTINLNNASAKYLYVDMGTVTLLDPTFTVGHSELYTVSNYSVWGETDAYSVLANSRWVLLNFDADNIAEKHDLIPQYGGYTDNADWYDCFEFTIIDEDNAVLKSFRIESPNDSNHPEQLKITRVI